jgi:hypothetical protein
MAPPSRNFAIGVAAAAVSFVVVSELLRKFRDDDEPEAAPPAPTDPASNASKIDAASGGGRFFEAWLTDADRTTLVALEAAGQGHLFAAWRPDDPDARARVGSFFAQARAVPFLSVCCAWAYATCVI